ncbi:hypothetical protein ED733_001728 [Metarhizium rileyi]|uniref:Peptidase S9 prolyl oligopeptidase catalytic domain-containing protein n=1 Tax=Metarhizium rileyi (strain RCEF 4871) TaxID=1649241 RepID=A0A5C6G0M3_METRR|nr:hypothetical protein ED733_001728 [Metarhizium rileyi]
MKVSLLSIVAGCIGLGVAYRRPSMNWEPKYRRDDAQDLQKLLSSDAEFHYEILRTMAIAPYEGSDISEVLVAAQQVKPGDYESYYSAFYSLAARVDKQAQAIDSSKYPVSARQAFFKAASYYRSADFFLHGNWSDPRINTIWDRALASFNSAMKLMSVPGERITLHAKDDNFTIPAIFFRSGLPGPRPTIIMGNGYDGSQEEMYHVLGQAVLQRGMNVITYEGPGQPTVRRQQNLAFIPEWDKVVTPVVDYALTRHEVDAKSIGLMGYSFGGYLAPRAAAFEHRIAAVLAIDGIYDYGQANLDGLGPLTTVFKSGNSTLFDYIIKEALANVTTETATRWAVQQGLWSFRVESPFEWMTLTQAYNLSGLTNKIKASVFVASAEDDQYFGHQAKLLADHLGKLATFHSFAASEGAGEHCSVGAAIMENQVVLDWFQGIIARDAGSLAAASACYGGSDGTAGAAKALVTGQVDAEAPTLTIMVPVRNMALRKLWDNKCSLASTGKAILKFLTAEESEQIYNQLRKACIPNKQVLWSGMPREVAQHWADKHGMQTLTTSMGPLMNESSPLCPRRRKSPHGWAKYIHGASVVFAWYIAGGDLVTVLSQPPPQRFNPSGGAYYQSIEEPVITGKLCERHVGKIMLVHPNVKGAEDFQYELWPDDHSSCWNEVFGKIPRRYTWRHTKVPQAVLDLKVCKVARLFPAKTVVKSTGKLALTGGVPKSNAQREKCKSTVRMNKKKKQTLRGENDAVKEKLARGGRKQAGQQKKGVKQSPANKAIGGTISKEAQKSKTNKSKAKQPKAKQPKAKQPKAKQPKAKQPKAKQPKAKGQAVKGKQPKEGEKNQQSSTVRSQATHHESFSEVV